MVYINKVKVVIFIMNKVLYSINKVCIKMSYLNSIYGTCRIEIKSIKGWVEMILQINWSGNEK